MAGLTDDWLENRQICIDVLCAYLRLPYEPAPDEESGPEHLAFRASREVRHTVIRVIAAHLKVGAAMFWQGLSFNFSDVIFDGGDFRDSEFSGGFAVFDGAEFRGGRVHFDGAKFSGTEIYVDGAKFSASTIDFSDAADWSHPPVFPWTDTPPSGVKLPSKDDQSQE